MNKNKRKPKLPVCKNVQLSLYLETGNIHPSSARWGLGTPTACFHPVGCSHLQPLSSQSLSLCIWTPTPGKVLEQIPTFGVAFSFKKIFSGIQLYTEHSRTDSKFIQFSRPTAIHLVHLDVWLCYSFSKLKCFSCSKISLVFKAKLVSYKNLALLSLINKKQNASVCLPSESVFTQCISFPEVWFIPIDQKLRMY